MDNLAAQEARDQEIKEKVNDDIKRRGGRFTERAMREYDALKGIRRGLSFFLKKEPVGKVVDEIFLNFDYRKGLKKQFPKAFGDKFGIFLSISRHHLDAPIQMEFLDLKQKEVIATLGFFIQKKGSGTHFNITNIQGVRGKESNLRNLSKALGENWRVWSAKFMKDIGKKGKMKVVGVFPFFFPVFCDYFEYKRVLRQCKQTFGKAGIKNIDSSLVEASRSELALAREPALRARQERRVKARKGPRRK